MPGTRVGQWGPSDPVRWLEGLDRWVVVLQGADMRVWANLIPHLVLTSGQRFLTSEGAYHWVQGPKD